MLQLLIALTVAEALLLVAVLAWALVRVARTLRAVSETLAKTAMGVRAIETHASAIGPSVDDLNEAARHLEASI